MGIAFAVLVVFHGVIHLMGFAKAFRFASLDQLRIAISKPWGMLWLLAAVVFVLVAIARTMKLQWWWMVAFAGLLLSQLLILLFWRDAKFGTIPNVIILVAAVLGIGVWRSARLVERDREALEAAAGASRAAPVTEAELVSLPESVQVWLRHSGVIGRPVPRSIHVQQRGRMQVAPGGRWMPFHAEQWFTTQRPGFVWVAEVDAAPSIHLTGRDKYVDGRGAMRIEFMSLIPVVNGINNRIDQGSRLRFLAEIVWFPSAAIRPYIKWEDAGSRAARATISDGSAAASGTFRFDDEGNVSSFEARRYRGEMLENWLVEAVPGSQQRLGGRLLPAGWRATWKLDGGDWSWIEFEVTSIDDGCIPAG